jgi:uncharacterized membrane protein
MEIMPNARKLVFVALGTSLVAVVTFVFQIYIPSTRGYFNIGESAVYVVALMGGPYAGAFAGGVGSMISDIMGGYFFYAPGTLVIKAVEGGVLGLLASRRPKLSRRNWALLSLAVGAIFFASIYLVGVSYFIGEWDVSLITTFVLQITPVFWLVIGLLAALFIVLTSLAAEQETGWLVVSAAVAGFFMVSGYFLYEEFILSAAAIAEVPFNIGQVLIGIIIALPVYKSLKSLRSAQLTET